MEQNKATEINDVAPSSLSHLIGQRGVIDQVRVALDAAQMDNKKFDHALLVGPPGMGKSALAAVIAQEMATAFHEVLGQSINNSADLNALLLGAKDKDIVHIDECHELQKIFQTALYLAVDKRTLIIQNGKTPMSLPLADFTLLLSTTDEYGLLQPCRDRMKLLLRFQFYDDAELVEVLRHRSKALRWIVDDTVLPEIAKRAKGTPRLALRLLQSARRCARADGDNTITVAHLHRACALEAIDELGLGPTETKYLDILTNGATRLNVIASMLALPSRTVSDVTEPFLLRAGLIIKDDQGRRQLTQKGMDHCHNGVKLPSDS
jgi:Holliday junction DNA helicase RuvB